MFIKHQNNKITVRIVYVNHVAVTGDDTIEIFELNQRLAKQFEMKDLRSLRYFLGTEVAGSDKGSYIFSTNICP